MDDKELKAMWQQNTQGANDYYNKIQPEVLQKAQQDSKDILAQIRRKILKELRLITFSILFGFLYFTYSSAYGGKLPIAFLILIIMLSGYHIMIYLKYFKKTSAVTTKHVIQALETKAEILHKHVRELRMFHLFSIPVIILLFGWMVWDEIPNMDSRKALIAGAVLFAYILATLIQIEYKIKRSYNKYLNKLKEIIQQLRSE